MDCFLYRSLPRQLLILVEPFSPAYIQHRMASRLFIVSSTILCLCFSIYHLSIILGACSGSYFIFSNSIFFDKENKQCSFTEYGIIYILAHNSFKMEISCRPISKSISQDKEAFILINLLRRKRERYIYHLISTNRSIVPGCDSINGAGCTMLQLASCQVPTHFQIHTLKQDEF